MPNIFYVKLKKLEAREIEQKGLKDLFRGVPNKFMKYRSCIEDAQTGDQYYRIKNVQYNGVEYDVIGWFNKNYPSMLKYTLEDVISFLPKHF